MQQLCPKSRHNNNEKQLLLVNIELTTHKSTYFKNILNTICMLEC